ncbi:MAG: hypothetical protein ACXW2C_09680 [Acidimicrobiia bacterium]
MPSVPNSDRPDTDRPVLDGRLDGGQLWLLTDPDGHELSFARPLENQGDGATYGGGRRR